MFLHIKNFGDELKRHFADKGDEELTLKDFEGSELL
jgi:hypothetical protein